MRASSKPEDQRPGDEHTAAGREEDRLLGAKVRSLRHRMGATLSTVAGLTGLSVGQLSEIERGVTAPSLRSLRLISAALATPVASLFELSEERVANQEQCVMRRENRPTLRLTPTGVIKTLLSPQLGQNLCLYEITVLPRGTSGGEFQTSSGQKAGVVTAGQVRLWLDNQGIDLEVGDSFQFAAHLPHALENPFDQAALLLWAVAG